MDLVRHPTFDVQAFFAAWEAALRAAGSEVPFGEAVYERLAALMAAVPDGHLTFRGAAPLGADARLAAHEYQSVVAGAWPSAWPTAPLLRRDGTWATVATLSARGGGEGLPPGGQAGDGPWRLFRRPEPGSEPAEAPPYEWHACGGAAVIRLRRFAGPPAVQRQLQRLAADYPLHAGCAAVVFDLRGNGGGSLEYALRWIARACGGAAQGLSPLETAVWPCAFEWNHLVLAQVRAAAVDTPGARDRRSALRARWPRVTASPPRLLSVQVREPSGPPLRGRVFVVVDRRTGSSGERAALDLRRLLGAILVGERTAGCLQYGQSWPFVLPRTALLGHLPIRRLFFDEEVESVGVPVDVYLEDIGQPADDLIPHLDAIADAVGARAGRRA